MRTAIRMWPLLLSAVCLAQTPDTSQKLLEEMKGVRATLNRLVQLMEAIEKGQRAALALDQMQLYDTQLRALRSQQDSLAAQERDLSRKASTLSDSARAMESGVGPSGAPTPGAGPDPAYRSDVSERLAAAHRLLQETRARQRSVNLEITTLLGRISTLEKALEEATAK